MVNYISEWRFIADAYESKGGFNDGSAIERFRRETDDGYKERKNSAKHEYENIFVSKISRYVGYLFKTEPRHETSNNILKTIFKDVDLSGNDANVFMSMFAQNAKARGVNLLLIESPEQLPDNLATQLKNRMLPYMMEINPERVVDYRLDKTGKFEFVAIEDWDDKSEFGAPDIERIIRYYDKKVWRIYDTNWEIIDEQEHGAGECPVLIFSEKGKFRSVGEFSQIAGLSKKLYNLESELKLLMRGQTFSLLTVQKDNGGQPEINIGVDNVLFYTGDRAPAYISSDASQAATYEERIEKVKESIDRIAYDVSTSKAQEAGISLQIKFEGLNSSLNKFSQRLESVEKRAWALICRKLGLPEDAMGIVYNMDFSITDLQTEVETLAGVTEIAELPQYKAAKLKKIVSQDLKSEEVEVVDAICDEIDNTVGKMSEGA